MKTSANTAVNILKFEHATEYIRALYAHYKYQDTGFTYEAWSVELGYKSRSFLKLVASGRRKITDDFVQNFSAKHSLSSDEESYFSLIAKHEQAVDEDHRVLFKNKILEQRGESKQRAVIENHDEYLKSPETPKVQVLLSFEDFEKTKENLAKTLAVEVSAVEQCLDVLQRLGLAQLNADGQHWEGSASSFKVAKKINNEALVNYHKMSMLEAIESQKLPGDLRQFKNVLLPLAPADYAELVQDIQELINKAVAKFDSSSVQGKRLYKLNIQTFPVTELVE